MKLKYVLKEFLTSEATYQNNLKDLLYFLVEGQQRVIKLKQESQSNSKLSKAQKAQQQTELTEAINHLNEMIANIKPLVIINQDFDKALTKKILELSASPEEEKLFVQRLKFSFEEGHFATFRAWTTQLAVKHGKYSSFIEKVFPLYTAGIIKSYLITPTQRFPRAKLLVERMVENAQGSVKAELQNLATSLGNQIANIEATVARDQSPEKTKALAKKPTPKTTIALSRNGFSVFSSSKVSLLAKKFIQPIQFIRPC